MSPNAPQPSHGPLRRSARRAGALALTACLIAAGGCGLRMGEGSPASLETPSQAQAQRDALARQAVLISTTAQVVSATGAEGSQTAVSVHSSAQAQVEALGGVWQPWATAVPTTYPTATPLATAGSDATTADLLAALQHGATMATQASFNATDPAEAQLYASLAASWSASVEILAPGTIETSPRSSKESQAGSQSLSGELVRAYDAARYACQEVAARSQGSDRELASDDAAVASAVVNAAVSAGSEDSRLAAYGAPTEPASGTESLDVTWARQVWSDLVTAEIQQVAATKAGTPERQAAVGAVVDAALRAQSWGEALPSLPGYAS
ncbi:Uncharacterised protein [Actinomyces slackii]|uniref:DUF4439 domain-containing protein n=2 Tax=Actinomyces slackii TaxID=52774 RepID=A0A3S4TDQ7_9ACTO|nr:Uncharacterised protein [Actinomyces slackii]